MSRILSFCLFAICSLTTVSVTAAPTTSEVLFTDFLPKYRLQTSAFILTKIEYTTEEMVVYFNYVAEQQERIQLTGQHSNDNWKLSTSSRQSDYTANRVARIENMRVNDELMHRALSVVSKEAIAVQAGDILTCELHFDLLPRTVRSVHLMGGAKDFNGAFRFNCHDLLIKSADSPLLGSATHMKSSVQRFYQQRSNIKYPDIIVASRLDADADVFLGESPQGKEETTAVQSSTKASPTTSKVRTKSNKSSIAEPIDYMPKTYASAADIVCHERMILNNIYYKDNRTEFSGRVQAMKTINTIVDNLKFYPKSSIELHGHTDIFGNKMDNLNLSEARVKYLKRVMKNKGVNPARIKTFYHGSTQPLPRYKNGGEQNRRVEVVFKCAD